MVMKVFFLVLLLSICSILTIDLIIIMIKHYNDLTKYGWGYIAGKIFYLSILFVIIFSINNVRKKHAKK
jgi:hypothetical protein